MAQPIELLLVDQRTLSREGLLRILAAESDFELIGATGDEREGFDLAVTLAPGVLVLDGSLSGLETIIRHLTDNNPAVKILVLALECNVQQAVRLLSLGATGYLCKHVTPKDLISAIRHVSRGETVLSPKAARGVVDQLMRSGTGPFDDNNNDDNDDNLHELLTEREIEVLQLLCQGLTDKEIGQKLHISPRTVNGHLGHIYAKLDVHSRTETMLLAIEKGWVSLG